VTSVPSIETPRGSTVVSSRAMTRVVSAVAAEALGIDPDAVSVDVTEDGGSLEIRVTVPANAVDDAEQTQDHIRSTVEAVTGARITAVTVRASPRLRLPRWGG
jgi:predicted transcriptional regulator